MASNLHNSLLKVCTKLEENSWSGNYLNKWKFYWPSFAWRCLPFRRISLWMLQYTKRKWRIWVNLARTLSLIRVSGKRKDSACARKWPSVTKTGTTWSTRPTRVMRGNKEECFGWRRLYGKNEPPKLLDNSRKGPSTLTFHFTRLHLTPQFRLRCRYNLVLCGRFLWVFCLRCVFFPTIPSG